jgi:SAM-dependent methyltransferase
MTAADARTDENRRQWFRKPALRAIYKDLYRRIERCRVSGPTLEIGAGSGNFRAADVISSDISYAPWLDVVADAHRLPFRDGSLANIVMIDALHHLEFPRAFFREALRALQPGGRIVMVEPAITAVSWAFYRFIHREPVRMGDDPLAEGVPAGGRDPFEANQAIPTLLVGRHRCRFAVFFPELALRRIEWLSLFAYPLSGGFQPWSAVPARLVGPLLRLEDALAPLVGRWMGFRVLIMMERAAKPARLDSRRGSDYQ